MPPAIAGGHGFLYHLLHETSSPNPPPAFGTSMLILGLGSNLGNRLQHLAKAIRALGSGPSPILSDIRVSKLYTSDALLLPGSPADWNIPFYNLAVSANTRLSPRELLSAIKEIEGRIGRKKRERWAPREIDIDILAFDDISLSDSDLTIPHPELLKREFALLPLLDLNPEYKRPANIESECKASPAADSAQIELKRMLSARSIPELMGILNITPDSLSDGGMFCEPHSALRQAELLSQSGASIIDIGAESTRPDAAALSPADEWQRLKPVLDLILKTGLPSPAQICVDTRHPENAGKALDLGVSMINDVSGLDSPEMRNLAASSSARFVFMHHLSIPVKRGECLAADCDPVETILHWAKLRKAELNALGICDSRLIFDPGIGFGLSAEQSWKIIERVAEFQSLGLPVLVGHSRKSFLSTLTSAPPNERDQQTLSVSLQLAAGGVDYLRVHNPAIHFPILLSPRPDKPQ